MANAAVAAKINEIQKSMEAEVAEIRKIESEYNKVFGAKQSLVEKKSENEMVLQELNMMEADAAVYKLVGPVLAKQDVGEAKNNVSKRVEFIQKEILRMDQLEVDFQTKIEEKKSAVLKLQEDARRVLSQQQQQKQ